MSVFTSLIKAAETLRKRKRSAPPADEIVSMKGIPAGLADYFTPTVWGGERAGRSYALAQAAKVPTSFNLNHPVLSQALSSLVGGLGGAAIGGLGGATVGAGLPGVFVGSSLGSLAGAVSAPYRRRGEMERINAAYQAASENGELDLRAPQLSRAAAVLLPMGGPYRTGEMEAYKAMTGGPSIQKQHGIGRDFLYASRALPYVSQVVDPLHGWAQNIKTQVDSEQEQERESARRAVRAMRR